MVDLGQVLPSIDLVCNHTPTVDTSCVIVDYDDTRFILHCLACQKPFGMKRKIQ